jgi:hypothetical protein
MAKLKTAKMAKAPRVPRAVYLRMARPKTAKMTQAPRVPRADSKCKDGKDGKGPKNP